MSSQQPPWLSVPNGILSERRNKVQVCMSVRPPRVRPSVMVIITKLVHSPGPGSAHCVCLFHPCRPCYPPANFPIRSCHKLSSQHLRSFPLALCEKMCRWPSMAPWLEASLCPSLSCPARRRPAGTVQVDHRVIKRPGSSLCFPYPTLLFTTKRINKYPDALSCRFPPFFLDPDPVTIICSLNCCIAELAKRQHFLLLSSSHSFLSNPVAPVHLYTAAVSLFPSTKPNTFVTPRVLEHRLKFATSRPYFLPEKTELSTFQQPISDTKLDRCSVHNICSESRTKSHTKETSRIRPNSHNACSVNRLRFRGPSRLGRSWHAAHLQRHEPCMVRRLLWLGGRLRQHGRLEYCNRFVLTTT